jgi:hypothetical protein
MGKNQIEELRKRGSYFSVPHGVSMKPMIYDRKGIVEIHTLEGEARRYDVVMYLRSDGVGVIHRVLHVKDDHYVIVGDNCWRLEYVPKKDVYGIAVRFYRKGKWYDCSCTGYRLYSHLWADLFFIRRPVFYIRDRIRSFLHISKFDT